MVQDNVLRIVQLCRAIDEVARDNYSILADLTPEEELRRFWQQMANAEDEHVRFWKSADKPEALADFPCPFDEPQEVIEELEQSLKAAQRLVKEDTKPISVQRAFVLAYRMEFYLLHPAFETLFHMLQTIGGDFNPEDEYAEHIEEFVSALSKYGHVTPELSLISDSLGRLWKDNRRLATEAARDELTGVLNRRGFVGMAELLVYLSNRLKSTIGFILVDLDDFKRINDRMGHIAGDMVLANVAHQLQKRLRKSDIIGRYGGDEFVILLAGIEPGASRAVAEDLRQTIADAAVEGIRVTASIGVIERSIRDNPRGVLLRLLQQADEAMYRAKAKGGNQVTSLDAEKTSVSP